jgi:hypothetical protein
MKEDEMIRTCRTHGVEETVNLGIDGRIILKWILIK